MSDTTVWGQIVAMRRQVVGHLLVAAAAALELSMLSIVPTDDTLPDVVSRRRARAILAAPRARTLLERVTLSLVASVSRLVRLVAGFLMHIIALASHAAVWLRRTKPRWCLELALVTMVLVGGHRATLPGLAYVVLVGVCLAVPRVRVIQWWGPMTLLLLVSSLLQYVFLFAAVNGGLKQERQDLNEGRAAWLSVSPSRWALVGDFLVLYVTCGALCCLCAACVLFVFSDSPGVVALVWRVGTPDSRWWCSWTTHEPRPRTVSTKTATTVVALWCRQVQGHLTRTLALDAAVPATQQSTPAHRRYPPTPAQRRPWDAAVVAAMVLVMVMVKQMAAERVRRPLLAACPCDLCMHRPSDRRVLPSPAWAAHRRCHPHQEPKPTSMVPPIMMMAKVLMPTVSTRAPLACTACCPLVASRLARTVAACLKRSHLERFRERSASTRAVPGERRHHHPRLLVVPALNEPPPPNQRVGRLGSAGLCVPSLVTLEHPGDPATP